MRYPFFCVLVLLNTRQVQSFFCEAAFYELSFFLVYWVHPSLGKCNLFFAKQRFMSYLFFLVYWFCSSPGKCNRSFVKQRFMSYLFSLCTSSACHQASAIFLLWSSVLWPRFAMLISRLKNTVVDLVWEKNAVLTEKTSWKVRIISWMNKAYELSFFPCVLVPPVTRQVQSFFCEATFYEVSFFLMYWFHPSPGKCNRSFEK
jgi:hypothetical protein